jgi:hypothetical protein
VGVDDYGRRSPADGIERPMVVYHTASDDETKGLDQGNRQWQHDAGSTGEAPPFSSGPRASGVGVSKALSTYCRSYDQETRTDMTASDRKPKVFQSC